MVKIEELEYLGFTFRGIHIFVSDRAMQDFKHRLRCDWKQTSAIAQLSRGADQELASAIFSNWGLQSVRQF